jgi:uncharacterized protein YciW
VDAGNQASYAPLNETTTTRQHTDNSDMILMTNYLPSDTIDRLVKLTPELSTFAVRHQRDKVVAATQKSEEGLFDPTLPGLTLIERLLVALLACTLTPSELCAAEYHQRLVHLKVEQNLLDLVKRGEIEQVTDARLRAMLTFSRTLITDPVNADQAALKALPQAGLSTPEVVTLAQLIAFVSYQVRVVAGLNAMKLLEQQA